MTAVLCAVDQPLSHEHERRERGHVPGAGDAFAIRAEPKKDRPDPE